jgi:type VII secretion protein EccB
VRHKDLVGQPTGTAIGIPGAPDDVPLASSLLTAPWTVCRAPGSGGAAATLAVVGRAVSGTTPQLSSGILVVDSGGNHYLIWERRRLAYRPEAKLLTALGWAGISPALIPRAVLDALPDGPRLEAPAIAGVGQLGPDVAGSPAHIGDIFQVRQRGDYYVLLSDGLARIGQTTLQLLLANGQQTPKSVDTSQLGGTTLSSTQVEPAGMPALVPAVRQDDTARPVLCVEYDVRESSNPTAVRLLDRLPGEFGAPGQTRTHVDTMVDWTVIPSARGVLARTPDGTVYLVDSQGIRYRIEDRAAQVALGFGGQEPATFPAALLAALPAGPVLSRAAAMAPIATASPSTANPSTTSPSAQPSR